MNRYLVSYRLDAYSDESAIVDARNRAEALRILLSWHPSWRDDYRSRHTFTQRFHVSKALPPTWNWGRP
jgi:hypothetical protein